VPAQGKHLGLLPASRCPPNAIREAEENVFILPRIAKALHHPALAAFLGLVLLAIGIFGLASSKIPRWSSILIIVVGVINMLQIWRNPSEDQPTHS
jgi:hypothetical protein